VAEDDHMDDNEHDNDDDDHQHLDDPFSKSQQIPSVPIAVEPLSSAEFGSGIMTQVTGPSIEMTCNRVTLQCSVGANTSIQLAYRNNGSTTLHYQWTWQALPIITHTSIGNPFHFMFSSVLSH
jgi:hypothetical protein